MVGKGSARQGSVYQSGGIAKSSRHGWAGHGPAGQGKDSFRVGGGYCESRGPACRGGVRSGTARLGKVYFTFNRRL
jgi:hypothetical protein